MFKQTSLQKSTGTCFLFITFILFAISTAPADAKSQIKVTLPCPASCAHASSTPIATSTASFDQSRITSLSSTPTLSGSAQNLNFPLDLRITKGTSTALAYENAALPVVASRWSAAVYPPISTGTYNVGLYYNGAVLATSTLTVGLQSMPRIESVFLPSFDVADGALIRFVVHGGTTGTIALNQFTFAFENTAADLSQLALNIFTDPSYSLLSTSTFPNGAVNSTLVDPDSSSRAVIVPDVPIEINPGQSYYFELDGSVSPTDSPYSIKTTLLGDFEATTTGTVSALSPISNFLWSPNTYGVASTSDNDWLNGAPLSTLPSQGIFQFRGNAPGAPVCNVTTDVTSANPGQAVTVTWTSSNTTYSVWSNGTKDTTSGSRTFTMGPTPMTFLLTFFGSGGNITCSTTVYASTPTTPPITPPVTPPSGTQPIATSSLGSFTVTPSTVTVSAQATFAGIVNTPNSCGPITYSLGYGDGATSTMNIGNHVCASLTFSFNHSYSKVGTYTAGLYYGTGVTAQRVQNQTVTVKAKVASLQTRSNFANVLNALGSQLSETTQTIFDFFRNFR